MSDAASKSLNLAVERRLSSYSMAKIIALIATGKRYSMPFALDSRNLWNNISRDDITAVIVTAVVL